MRPAKYSLTQYNDVHSDGMDVYFETQRRQTDRQNNAGPGA